MQKSEIDLGEVVYMGPADPCLMAVLYDWTILMLVYSAAIGIAAVGKEVEDAAEVDSQRARVLVAHLKCQACPDC